MIYTQDELIEILEDLGFEMFIPRTSSWKFCFTYSNSSETLYILIGKQNIDFKYYDHLRELRTDDVGKLYTDGGTLVRNYYYESNKNIHEFIIQIAEKFVDDYYLDDDDLKGLGISIKDRKKLNEEKQKF